MELKNFSIDYPEELARKLELVMAALDSRSLSVCSMTDSLACAMTDIIREAKDFIEHSPVQQPKELEPTVLKMGDLQ